MGGISFSRTPPVSLAKRHREMKANASFADGITRNEWPPLVTEDHASLPCGARTIVRPESATIAIEADAAKNRLRVLDQAPLSHSR